MSGIADKNGTSTPPLLVAQVLPALTLPTLADMEKAVQNVPVPSGNPAPAYSGPTPRRSAQGASSKSVLRIVEAPLGGSMARAVPGEKNSKGQTPWQITWKDVSGTVLLKGQLTLAHVNTFIHKAIDARKSALPLTQAALEKVPGLGDVVRNSRALSAFDAEYSRQNGLSVSSPTSLKDFQNPRYVGIKVVEGGKSQLRQVVAGFYQGAPVIAGPSLSGHGLNLHRLTAMPSDRDVRNIVKGGGITAAWDSKGQVVRVVNSGAVAASIGSLTQPSTIQPKIQVQPQVPKSFPEMDGLGVAKMPDTSLRLSQEAVVVPSKKPEKTESKERQEAVQPQHDNYPKVDETRVRRVYSPLSKQVLKNLLDYGHFSPAYEPINTSPEAKKLAIQANEAVRKVERNSEQEKVNFAAGFTRSVVLGIPEGLANIFVPDLVGKPLSKGINKGLQGVAIDINSGWYEAGEWSGIIESLPRLAEKGWKVTTNRNATKAAEKLIAKGLDLFRKAPSWETARALFKLNPAPGSEAFSALKDFDPKLAGKLLIRTEAETIRNLRGVSPKQALQLAREAQDARTLEEAKLAVEAAKVAKTSVHPVTRSAVKAVNTASAAIKADVKASQRDFVTAGTTLKNGITTVFPQSRKIAPFIKTTVQKFPRLTAAVKADINASNAKFRVAGATLKQLATPVTVTVKKAITTVLPQSRTIAPVLQKGSEWLVGGTLNNAKWVIGGAQKIGPAVGKGWQLLGKGIETVQLPFVGATEEVNQYVFQPALKLSGAAVRATGRQLERLPGIKGTAQSVSANASYISQHLSPETNQIINATKQAAGRVGQVLAPVTKYGFLAVKGAGATPAPLLLIAKATRSPNYHEYHFQFENGLVNDPKTGLRPATWDELKLQKLANNGNNVGVDAAVLSLGGGVEFIAAATGVGGVNYVTRAYPGASSLKQFTHGAIDLPQDGNIPWVEPGKGNVTITTQNVKTGFDLSKVPVIGSWLKNNIKDNWFVKDGKVGFAEVAVLYAGTPSWGSGYEFGTPFFRTSDDKLTPRIGKKGLEDLGVGGQFGIGNLFVENLVNVADKFRLISYGNFSSFGTGSLSFSGAGAAYNPVNLKAAQEGYISGGSNPMADLDAEYIDYLKKLKENNIVTFDMKKYVINGKPVKSY